MSKGNQVIVESLPLDKTGQPLISGISSAPGKARRLNTESGRFESVDAVEILMDMDRKVINIPNAIKGRPISLCEGAKVEIRVADAKDVPCPATVTLGDVTFLKDIKYEFTYSDIPVKGMTKQDISSRDPNQQVKLYPAHIETQKELLECIFRHESMYISPFVRYKVNFPPEIQLQMDVNALVQKQQLLEDVKQKQEEEFRINQRNLAKEREKLINKVQEHKKELLSRALIEKEAHSEAERQANLSAREQAVEEVTAKVSYLLQDLGVSPATIKPSLTEAAEEIEEQRIKQEKSKQTSKK